MPMTAQKLRRVIFVSRQDLSDTFCPRCLHNHSLFHAGGKIKRSKRRETTTSLLFLGHQKYRNESFFFFLREGCKQLTAKGQRLGPPIHYLFGLSSFCWLIYELQTGGPAREEEEEVRGGPQEVSRDELDREWRRSRENEVLNFSLLSKKWLLFDFYDRRMTEKERCLMRPMPDTFYHLKSHLSISYIFPMNMHIRRLRHPCDPSAD